MMKRIMENKILFVKNIRKGNNELMKNIVRNLRIDKDTAKIKNKEKERQLRPHRINYLFLISVRMSAI